MVNKLLRLLTRGTVTSIGKDREGSVSVLAIGIVGLHQIVEKFTPDVAFDKLRQLYSNIGRTVARFGGITTDSFREGFLCLFEGRRLDNHADQALRCAVQIQKDNLPLTIAAAAEDAPVFALQIGLTSGHMYLGNLAGHSSQNLAMVGHCLDKANAFREACELHSVLFGGTTRDLLIEIDKNLAIFKPRMVHVKNQGQMLEAYEYDPFEDNETIRRQALEALRSCANMRRGEQRWPIKDQNGLLVVANTGPADVDNVSKNGICLMLPKPIPVGNLIHLTLDSPDGVLKRRLATHRINSLEGEVRWIKTAPGQYQHGILYMGLSDKQKEYLLAMLLETQNRSAM